MKRGSIGKNVQEGNGSTIKHSILLSNKISFSATFLEYQNKIKIINLDSCYGEKQINVQIVL